MAFGKYSETEKLQSLVKSCLLEINKLKMDLVKAENEKNLLKDDGKIERLESLIKEKKKEIDDLKIVLEKKSNVISENETLIKIQKSKIEDLGDFKDSFNDIKDSLEKDLNNFKTQELSEQNEKLKTAIETIVEKDNKINSLLKEIEEFKEKIIDLESNISNRDSILKLQKEINNKDNEIKILKLSLTDESAIKSFQKELDEKNKRIFELEQMKDSFNDIKVFLERDIEQHKNQELEKINKKLESSIETIVEKDQKIKDLVNEIQEKDNQLKMLGENNVSKESYLKLKQEIDLKNEKIKRLEKIKGLFSELDKDYLTEKQKSISENIGLKDVVTVEEKPTTPIIPQSENVNNKISNKEIIKLKKELKTSRETIKELEEIKHYYNQLIAPPKKDLTSFQSQIYSLIPNKKMNTQEIHNYIRKIAFKNLSYININNILKNLERKGYLEMEEVDDDIIWLKTDEK